MSTATTSTYAAELPFIHDFAGISLGATTHPPHGRWDRAPITLFKRDVFSRFVLFDGKRDVCVPSSFLTIHSLIYVISPT